MVATRRYFFAHAGPFLQEDGHRMALRVIEWQAIKKKNWYTEAKVEGEALGTLTFSFVVVGEDRWQAHKRAMLLARTIYRGLKLPIRLIPEPVWTSLPPHANRGHQRIRKVQEVAP